MEKDKKARSADAGTLQVNPGYPLFQITRALTTAEGHEDRATRERARQRVSKWTAVLNGYSNAFLPAVHQATTLDTACRIQRYCLGELGKAWGIKALSNRTIASAIAAFTPLALVLETADSKPMWLSIWPVFGSSNQMLGALTLLVVTVWLTCLRISLP